MRLIAATFALALAAAPLSAASPVGDADRSAIVETLDGYAAAWKALDLARLASFWDASDETPLYLAEEVDAVFVDKEAIRDYWTKNAAAFSSADLRFSEVRIKPLDRKHALVAFHMDWRIAFKSPAAKALAADNRVVALMRRTGEGWRLAAWIEAPLAPTVFLRKELERNAAAPQP